MKVSNALLIIDTLLNIVERAPVVAAKHAELIAKIHQLRKEGRDPTEEEWALLRAERERLTQEILTD